MSEISFENNSVAKKNLPKIWHKQQELILKKWSEIGSSYRFMHDRSFIMFQRKNMRFALPVIVISTITGTANFAQSSFPAEWEVYVPLIIGFFNLLAGLITTISQFLRVSELLEGHRAATIAYSKFSRNISVELSLPREERNSDGTEFVNNSRNELDRLIEQSPNIPMNILRRFGKKFNKKNFNKPEILEITPVDIYIDNEKEKMEEELSKIKNAEQMRRELISTENLRRQSVLDEIRKKEEVDNILTKNTIENKKTLKKSSVNALKVNKSLDKLMSKLNKAEENNDIVTPSSSETESEKEEATNKNIVIDISENKV
tara:strand:- start:437 stop:1387 length:951 start_codon:yes stop_codon:yes gene_type:complete